MPTPFFDLKMGHIMDMKNVDDRDVYMHVLGALNTGEWGYEPITHYPKKLMIQIAGRVALKRIGIECDFDGDITKEKLGYAIGKKVEEETGVYFGNIFDRESVKRGVMQYGCKRALHEMGFDDEPQTIEGVAHAVGRLAQEWRYGHEHITGNRSNVGQHHDGEHDAAIEDADAEWGALE